MDKVNMVYVPNWNITYPLKEGNPVICDNMDDLEYIKWRVISQTQNKHLYTEAK
jgi:hypothetical protein